MFDFTYELEQLEAGDRSPELVERIIGKHKERAAKMKELYERYKGDTVPIFYRVTDDPMEINSQLANDFYSKIIDTKVGYFSGNATSYVLEEEGQNKLLQDFLVRNRISDVDAETTKWAAICGYAARLVYIPTNQTEERIVNIQPWEAILLGENGMDEADYGIRYYMMEGESGQVARVELYDNEKVYDFEGRGFGDLELMGETDHVFDYCPMFGIMNNEELIGDAEKVLTLIDAYDRAFSDVNSEIEAFRSAYLAFFGVMPPGPDEEDDFKKNGTLYFMEGQDGKFITKVIQDVAVENHLNRLHENIHNFSSTPDLGDKNFAGTQTGPAMKYKILGLENKCASFERKMTSSNIRQFEIINSSNKKKGLSFDPYEVKQHYSRNFPEDLEAEARVQALLNGLVPEDFRFSKFTGVDNPKQMAEEFIAQKNAYAQEAMNMQKEEDLLKKKLGGDDNGSTATSRTRDTKEAK